MPLKLTEAQWGALVIEAAQRFGWLAMHTRPARTAKGWRTPIQGDRGFPDLVLVGPLVLFIELKTDTGTLDPDQRRWRDALLAAGQTWDLWRPRMWPHVEHVLTGRPKGACPDCHA